MKLNSTASMIPLTMPGFGGIHPFVPLEQTEGYQELIKVRWLLPFRSDLFRAHRTDSDLHSLL